MLPTRKIGNLEITRLIVGSNPFTGKSHLDENVDADMKDYFTDEAAFAMLARRSGNVYSPGCSESDVRQAAATLGEKHLADELATLCLLLSGDYTTAVITDPYRNNEEATAPFAVMMRDWKARLKL